MAFKYNPLLGGLDMVGTTGTPPAAVKYSVSFNNTTHWTLNGSFYEINIPESTHGAGTTPITQVFEVSAGISTEVLVNISFNGSGDIIIRVASTPDNRFTGAAIVF